MGWLCVDGDTVGGGDEMTRTITLTLTLLAAIGCVFMARENEAWVSVWWYLWAMARWCMGLAAGWQIADMLRDYWDLRDALNKEAGGEPIAPSHES